MFFPQYFKRSNVRNETSTLECALCLVFKIVFLKPNAFILVVNVCSLDESFHIEETTKQDFFVERERALYEATTVN